MDRTQRAAGWLLCAVFALTAMAQNGGRFELTKRQALAYLESSQFDKAAGKLEDIWEQEKTDATIAEDLAIAYLNGEDRQLHDEVAEKAHALAEKAIKLGGRATFLVQHSHQLGVLQGKTIIDYCSGKLSISPGKLVFVAQAGKTADAHSFEMTAAEFTMTPSDSIGAFQIKGVARKSKHYTILPRSRVKADGDWIVALINEHVRAQ
jgi:hypothetical protein